LDTLWYTRCPVPTPLGLASQLGWLSETFEAQGLKVESVLDSPSRAVRESHFSHHLPGSFRQGGNIPPLWARASGAQTALVAITWTDEFQAVITLPGRGLGQAADLKGRRLALPRRNDDLIDFHRATALKGIWSSLATAELDLSDVTLVDVLITESGLPTPGEPSLQGLRRRHPYFAEMVALIRGEVDAIFVKGPEGILVANLMGAAVVSETGHHADPVVRINNGTPRPLTVDRGLLAERPEVVAQLLGLVRRAGAWAAEHPDETLRFVAREIGCSEDAVRASAGDRLHEQLGIGLSRPLVAAIDSFKDFLHTHGFLPSTFEMSQWVAPEALESLTEPRR